MKLDITRQDLNIIICLVRNFRSSVDSIDSYSSDEHIVLESKKHELDSLIQKLFDFEDN